MADYQVKLRRPHPKQASFVHSTAKRVVNRSGRRSGKTTGVALIAALRFLKGQRVLYAAPTSDQVGKFWFEIMRAFAEPIDAGYLYLNKSQHILEIPGTETRIRAKTAWNADSLRGDYADVLIFDEWQLMNEDAWGVVGAPMLLDNNGDAIFIYTPPSLRSRSVTKATDPRHAAKMFKKAQANATGRWETFHFTSHDNPHISKIALRDITQDMTSFAYRQEIMAEDIEDNPGALWRREWIVNGRVLQAPELARVVVAMDPSASKDGDACGIVGAGRHADQFFVLEDATVNGTPSVQSKAAITLYHKLQADALIVEKNNGGDWLETVIKNINSSVNVKLIHASRGKQTRAEPVSAIYEPPKGELYNLRAHHVGTFQLLEDELCQWEPGQASPNRLDALVWAATELMFNKQTRAAGIGTNQSAPRKKSRWQ